MSFSDSYASVDDYKLRRKDTTYDLDADSRIGAVLLAASRAVDVHCRRLFGKSDSAETRVYTATSRTFVAIDDLALLSGVTVEVDLDADLTCETTLATSDYYFEQLPLYVQPDPPPYSTLRLAPLAAQAFPLTPRAIAVTGLFGWPSVPQNVIEATLRLASRLEALPSAPLGIAQASATTSNTFGGSQGGTRLIMPDDADVKRLLAPYVRPLRFV